MATINVASAKEFKGLLENRKSIQSVGDINCTEMYPMFDCSNKHASYYNVDKQEYTHLIFPVSVELNDNTNK